MTSSPPEPDRVQSLNVDAIIRGGLTRFTDSAGQALVLMSATTSVAVTSRRCLGRQGSTRAGAGPPPSHLNLWGHLWAMGGKHVPVCCLS